VKQDKAANPIQIGLLGADAIVLKTDFVPHLVEQAGLGLRSGGGGISHVSTWRVCPIYWQSIQALANRQAD